MYSSAKTIQLTTQIKQRIKKLTLPLNYFVKVEEIFYQLR